MTAATVLADEDSPLPLQVTVTFTELLQWAQAKSIVRFNFIMILPASEPTELPRTRRRSRVEEHGRAAVFTDLLAFALGAVLGSGLLPVGNALGVEHTANDVVANSGEVADAAATDQHD